MAKDREVSIFNMSFLDVLSCGMGSVMLLSFVFAALPKDEPAPEGYFASATFRIPKPLADRGWSFGFVLLRDPVQQKSHRIARGHRGVYLWQNPQKTLVKIFLENPKSRSWFVTGALLHPRGLAAKGGLKIERCISVDKAKACQPKLHALKAEADGNFAIRLFPDAKE